ncbi:ATP phosphoribosyltransferase regulatory subunit [Pelagibacterium xiamenense]|uniref:ATP phosphoribosyltransferase regulatory subunit n=1 Tax=Pelagibacterium xiamenense TaxID=2901140 RepID=UPI001E435E5B|nr:ATP phosphoribosyltransferase regulatory subunit [Pelagibacterium xiamenense]MCD7059198.1 ATP phosphoribosyltransferase regulatory subunit [Pelagibacterium xiamenense]
MTAAARREALKGLVSGEGVTFATTPILIPPAPYFDLAGEEFGARMILTTAADGAEFCLRPDFTLPIAMGHLEAGAATPAAYGYLGPVFRQRAEGPAEFDQAGLELLAQPDPEAALERIIGFARNVLELYAVAEPSVRVGSIDLFETLLAACDMPDVWRPRIRARFGHPEAMARLLDRLADPHKPMEGPKGMAAADIADWVRELMLSGGLSLSESRSPEEIARRYVEKQALEAAQVPGETIALLKAYLAISGEAGAALGRIADLAVNANIYLGTTLEVTHQRLAQLRNGNALGSLTFDAGFSPRLDYYTGITFEVTGRDGAVLASGGQYDRLLNRLGAGSDIPAVGCAVWVARLEKEAPR